MTEQSDVQAGFLAKQIRINAMHCMYPFLASFYCFGRSFTVGWVGLTWSKPRTAVWG